MNLPPGGPVGDDPDELFRHGRRLNRLLRQATRHDLDDEARFVAILDEACRSLGLNLLFLAEWDDLAGVRFRHVRLDGNPAELSGDVAEALRGLALASQEPLVLEDLARDPVGDGQLLMRETGLVFYAGVPVWSGDTLAGVLGGLARCGPGADGFSEANLAYLELVAGWLGHHLYQVRQRLLLERHALTDALTGLLNRRAAEGRLHEELARARRHGESFAVALVDIDHFKRVNDRYGHAVGDQVLKVVSRRLEAGLRDDDWLARWGGEEFLIFLRNADVQEASYVMQRLTGHVKAQPIATQVGNIAITLSAGIGLPERDDADYHPVVELADSCLYQAKSNGRDRVEAFDATATHWPVQVVKRALRDARVRVATQVIVDLETGQPVADESLARVALPDGRLVTAGEFVEVAEGLGLMSEIDRYVTRQAMARCTANLSQGKAGSDFAHFVNLSPQFLARRDLVEEMLANAVQYCESCQLDLGPVKPIVFEITERQFLSNLDTLEADLKPLLDFGFRLALDDFGSGYSSFLYLARLPISYLKIEGWMVANMKQQRKIAAIVESLAGFARRENIITVAECIEDAETARILRDMGVHLGQGWYFGRPELEENHD